MRDISLQPTLNIGTIGHVAHGKSTLVKQISSTNPIKFKSELERNITIKLGYANAKIYKCLKCERPDCYQIQSSCATHDEANKLVKHVSFIDCPGHDVLMATMLSGASIMDNVILLIAANESVPKPQTIEHLFALELIQHNSTKINIKNENEKRMIIVQNKIDLINKESALENYSQIISFVKNSIAEGAPIIPTAIQKSINIAPILDYIVQFPEPEFSPTGDGKMVIIRSFDINKPKKITKGTNIFGGVLGGTIISGSLKVNQEIEIRPGRIESDGKKESCKVCMNNTNFKYSPFYTTIVSLKSEDTEIETAYSGGLIAVQTLLDPFFCKSDKLVGQIIGTKNSLPLVYDKLTIKYKLLEKVINNFIISPLILNEALLLNIGSESVGATVSKYCDCLPVDNKSDDAIYLNLFKPVCCNVNDKIAISRKLNNHWRLIGFGEVLNGSEVHASSN